MSIISKEQIQHSKKDPEFLKKLIAQLQKDFQWYNETIALNERSKHAYDELFEQVLPIITRMLNLDSQRFFSLLYAIDVDESEVKKLLFGKEELNAERELTHLILERELLKVLSRHIFSQQQNKKTFWE